MLADLDTVLTAADHDHFLEHGYVLLPGLVDPALCVAAVEQLERTEDRAPGVVEACLTDDLQRAVRELCGPSYTVPTNTGVDDKPRPHQPELHWTGYAHCDLIYPTLLPGFWAVGAFVFLTKAISKGGAFLYAPDSPINLGAFASGSSAEAIWGAARDERLGGRLTECIADPGDVILFQHRMVHAGSLNRTDPATRHALRISWSPVERVVPGGKPESELSTVEKANSVRWLRSRFGDNVHVLEPAASAGEDLAVDVTSHAVMRFGGRIHLFTATADSPIVDHTSSVDLCSWTSHAPLDIGEPIRSLHAEYRFRPTLVVAVETDPVRSHVLESQDLEHWTQVAALDETAAGRPYLVQVSSLPPFFSKQATGNVLPFVPDGSANEVWARWGASRDEIGAWGEEARIGVAPDGLRIRDAAVWCIRDVQRYALIADVNAPDGELRAYASVATKMDEFPDPLAPLAADERATNVRVVERGRAYFLCTYQCDGHVRLGAIDWEDEMPMLRRLATYDDVVRALQLVGLS